MHAIIGDGHLRFEDPGLSSSTSSSSLLSTASQSSTLVSQSLDAHGGTHSGTESVSAHPTSSHVVSTLVTTISGMSTTVVSSMAITSPSEGMNSTASVATSSPTLHTPIPVIVGVAGGGAIGLVLLSILLGTLCRGRRRGKHSFKNKAGGDGDMIRPSKQAI